MSQDKFKNACIAIFYISMTIMILVSVAWMWSTDFEYTAEQFAEGAKDLAGTIDCEYEYRSDNVTVYYKGPCINDNLDKVIELTEPEKVIGDPVMVSQKDLNLLLDNWEDQENLPETIPAQNKLKLLK